LLVKQRVVGPVVYTPKSVKPVEYKWIFVQKQNKNGEIVRYKTWLDTQGFSQYLVLIWWSTIS